MLAVKAGSQRRSRAPRARAGKKLLLAAALSSIVMSSLALTVPAGAAVQDVTSVAAFLDVACPSTTQCLGVGFNSDASAGAAAPLDATTGEVTAGQGGQSIAGTGLLVSVSCPSTTICLAVGSSENDDLGESVSLNPATGGIAAGQSLLTITGVGAFNYVACPSTTQCLAVGQNSSGTAVAVPLNPVTGEISSTESAQTIPGIGGLFGLACSSTTQCLAVGSTTNGTEGQTVPLDPATGQISSGQSVHSIAGSVVLNNLTCISTSDCLAVGNNADGTAGEAVSLNPTSGAVFGGQSVQTISGVGGLISVKCPSVSTCLAVGANTDFSSGQAAALNPTTGALASGQSAQSISGSGILFSVVCPTATPCLAVGTDSQLLTGLAVPLDPATGAQPITPGSYTPLAPVRICDTRSESVSHISAAPFNQCDFQTIAAGGTLTINVANEAQFNVPADATAVVLNVTVVNPTGPGFVTVFPAGADVPNASNLNYVGGEVVPNLVEVGTGSMGQASFSSQNQTDLVVDLEGYTTAAGAGLYTALSPTRICDTRAVSAASPSNQCNNGVAQAAGFLNPAQPLSINVANAGATFGVPAGATAAVLNITDTNPDAAGFMTVYPQGTAEPNASNLNFAFDQTTANRVIVPLSDTGDITVATTAPSDLVVDVSGYYSASGAQFSAESAPVRICDTRPASSFSPSNQCTAHGAIGGGSANQMTINVRGLAGVPVGATAAVVNVTGIGPTQSTFLTVFPSGTTVPNASDLNLGAGETRANLDVATVNPSTGEITIWNQTGSLNVIVDVLGWYS
jgi:hypothetical protein